MNRRVVFFAGAATLCLALTPVAEDEFRWLPLLLGSVYAVLALLVGLDALSRRKR